MISTCKAVVAATFVAAASLMAGAASAATTYTFDAVGPAVDWIAMDGVFIAPGATGILNGGDAKITQTAEGLGVRGSPDIDPGTIDGFPVFSNEYLRITFTDPVRLLRFTLGEVDANDHVNVYFDDTPAGVYNVATNNPFETSRIVSSFIVKATGTFGEDGFGDDNFTLASFTVAPVPVPAAGLLLAGGLGLLAALRRRAAAAA